MSTNLPPLMESRLAQALLDHSDLGVIGLDAEGRVAVWNEWMAGRTGIASGDAFQRALEDLFPQLPSTVRNEIRAALATGAPRVLSPVLHAAWLPQSPAARQVVRLLPWHEQGGMLILIQDVTGQLAYEQRAEEVLRRTNRALRVLSECNQAVVRAADETQLLDDSCRIIVEEGGFALAWVGYAEHDPAKTVRAVAQAGLEDGRLDTIRASGADDEWGRGPAGRAIRSGQPAISRDLQSDPDYAPWRDEAAGRGCAAAIALPLIADGRTLGALNICAADLHAFDAEEVRLLGELAADLAYGVAALRTRAAREQAEAQRVRQDWENIFQAIGHPAVILDAQQRVIAVNRATIRATAESEEALLGRRCYEIFHGPQADQPPACCPFRQMLSAEQPATEEMEVEALGGWFLVSCTPVFDQAGRLDKVIHITTDITERKRAELALREQMQRTVQLLQTTLDGYILADTAGQVVDVNSAYCNLIGYTRDELLQMNIRQLEGQLSPQEIERRIELLVQQGGARFETQHQRKDGRLLDLDVSITIIQQQDGPLVAAFVRDITESKQAAEALRQSERYNRNLFESSPIGLALCRMDGALVDVNPAYARIIGRNMEEMLPLTYWDITPEKYAEEEQRQLESLRANGRYGPYEKEYIHADGHLVPVRLQGQLIEQGGEQYIWLSVEDITERKRAEEALNRTAASLNEAQRIAHIGSWELDITNNILAWSDEIYRMFEIDPAKFGASYEAFLDAIHPDDREAVNYAYTNSLQVKIPYAIDHRLLFPDGRIKYVHERCETFYDNDKPIRSVGTVQDITERKQAEVAEREQRALAEALRDTATALNSTLDFEDLLERILANAGRVMPHDTANIMLLEDGIVRVVRGRGYAERGLAGFVAGLRFPLAEITSLRDMAATNRPLAVPDTQAYPDWKRWPGIDWVRSYAGAPIRVKGQVIGFLNLDSTVPGFFTQTHAERLQAFADQAGVAIENARLYAETDRLRAFSEGIVQGMQEGICIEDADGRIAFVNPMMARMVGCTEAELLGQHWSAIVAAEQRPKVAEETCRRAEGMAGRYETILLTSDGRQTPVIVGSRPMYEGERFTGVLSVFADITDRAQREEAQARLAAQIQEHAQRVQLIIDTVPEGVVLLDAEGRVVLANPQGQQVLTTLARAAVGDVVTQLAGRPLAELLAPPLDTLWHEVRAGSRAYDVVARPLQDDPAAAGWVLVLRDVTQEREIQQRIQQQERLAAVGQLAAGIAHDFNNIMAVITLRTEMALQEADLSPRTREQLAVVSGQAKRAAALIQQILDFSRRAALERVPMDLSPFLKEVIKLLERTLLESVRIKLSYGPGEYVVNADPTRIQQAIMNLAINARDAMPRGGRLQIALERTQVRPGEPPPLPGMDSGEWVQIGVTDTGTGIASDVLPHIFEPFFTTKAPGQGSGLGLAQVWGIVQQHDGHIGVTTKVGHGTTFTIYLPSLATAQPEPEPVAELALPPGAGKAVLIVEDDATTRGALADTLELLAYQPLPASNGEEALELFERHRDAIALVLTDFVMPVMGGEALLRTLRERGWNGPAVVLSGYPLGEENAAPKIEGIVEWLQKPISVERLAQTVARWA
jgi:PAS domain S-box-containing protein